MNRPPPPQAKRSRSPDMIRQGRAKKVKLTEDSNKNPTSFLSLPTELRLQVYKHLLPTKKIPAFEKPTSLRLNGKRCHLAILSVCRLINEEASDLLYGSVPYVFKVSGRSFQACCGRTWHTKNHEIVSDTSRASIFRFVRQVEVVVHGDYINRWKDVHRTARRKNITKIEFDEMFQAYDTRQTVVELISRLQSSPRLEHISVSMTRSENDVSAINFFLDGFKSARNIPSVTFGKICTHPHVPWGGESEERKRKDTEHKAVCLKFKHEAIAAMTSDKPVNLQDFPPNYAAVEQLRSLIWSFKGHQEFYQMCKTLYEARHAEALGDVRGFDKCTVRLLSLVAAEHGRIKAVLTTAQASIAALSSIQSGGVDDSSAEMPGLDPMVKMEKQLLQVKRKISEQLVKDTL